MTTANEQFLDAMIRHQIYLLRLSGSVRNRILKLIDATERDVRSALEEGLAPLVGQPLTPARQRALERTLRSLEGLRMRGWKMADGAWEDEMLKLAQAEPAFIAGTMQTVSPVILDLNIPSTARLEAIVRSKPFNGKTLKDWASSIARADVERITDQIKIGLVQGETLPQISKRIVGTAALKGQDGVTQISRRNAEALTRTATNAIGNAAKREFFEENRDIISEEQYVATLDARTTSVCKAYDGKRYPVGKGPIPPLHFGCRSLRVAVIDGEVMGQRPAKPVTEKMLLREYAKEHGFSTPSARGGLPRGHKASFDKFARARTRELTGPIPAKVTYQKWLERQPKAFVEDTLGVTKAKLFREGKLPLDKFINRQGDELTLGQLAQRHRDAFKDAGLDPEDFL